MKVYKFKNEYTNQHPTSYWNSTIEPWLNDGWQVVSVIHHGKYADYEWEVFFQKEVEY